MPLSENLLSPIAGDNPSGTDVRYDTKLLIYDKIKEARRQDDNLDQGDWQHERKVADFALVKKLAQETLSTRTKDLQLAAWLTEAMLWTEGYSGLHQGLVLCQGLIANFWPTLYPPVDDGDLELRAAPLDWIGSALEIPIKSVPLVRSGYDWFKYKESRSVGYEQAAQTDKEKEIRTQRIAEGKLTPELFDKAFTETPKAFYVQAEKDLDNCLETIRALDELCSQNFGDSAPSLGKLKIATEEVRHSVHTLLQKKRETEPDVVEQPLTAASVEGNGQPSAGVANSPSGSGPAGMFIGLASSEPADRRQAISAIATAAAFLRKREPYSPAPYLMMRGLRWGELRAAAQNSDATQLEAPPTELRQHIKRLLLSRNWAELLETAENAMSLPCSRAWLDLQRASIEACDGLGSQYEGIANAIRSELRALLTDLPQLLDASLLDDTPTANSETKAWLKRLLEASSAAPSSDTPEGAAANPSWPAKASDSYALAQQALGAGFADKAFEIMRSEIARQRSGRGRFQRTLQLVNLCVSSGKQAIAQPLLEDLAAAIENHKLEDWEEREMIAAALATIMTVSARVQEDAAERQKLFERICRLDPVRALGAG
jgi:type VI secretion system protein ImpA